MAAINLAVDTIELKPGLPKAFRVIEDNFRYLVKQMVKYNYIVFFNINITSKNLEDVKLLTEIARANNIGTDYHVCEPPLIEKEYYKHKESDFWIKPEQLEEFDELIDWLIKKEKEGYPMINSVRHLNAMKKFVRHQNTNWGCRAGHNGSFISVEGEFFPCFEMMNRKEDYGDVREGDKFNEKQVREQIDEMKKECQKHCLSTCFYTMSSYYDPKDMWSWVAKHARVGG